MSWIPLTALLNGVPISGTCGSEFILAAPGISGLGIHDTKVVSELARYGTHGLVSGPDYLNQRSIGIPIMIFSKDDPAAAMADLRTLKTAWQPQERDVRLDLTVEGYGPSDDVVRFYGRPRNALNVDLSVLRTGFIGVLATFMALDPIGYGPEETTALVDGATVVTNPGDAPTTRATIEILGDGGNPVLSNSTLGGRTIIFTSPIPNGETWTVDLFEQTVEDGSGDDQFSKISPASTWFGLGSGDNTINLSGAASGSITLRGGWW